MVMAATLRVSPESSPARPGTLKRRLAATPGMRRSSFVTPNQPRKPRSRQCKLLAFAIATIALCTLPAARGQLIYTTFDIPSGSPTVGQFPNSNRLLWGLEDLTGGSGFNFAYAYRYFTPSVTGSYTMGMTDGTYDPVMVLYSGQTSFPVADASVGVIGFNDDGAWDLNADTYSFGTQVVNSSAADGFPQYMPLIKDMTLTAGTNYLVAITSFASMDHTFPGPSTIPLPAEFFVAGPAAVTVAPVPEPSTVALAAIGLAGAGLALRRRQLARRTSHAAAS